MADLIIHDREYDGVNRLKIPNTNGDNTYFYDTTEADVASEYILKNKVYYGRYGKIIGSMNDYGEWYGTMYYKDSHIPIPNGHVSGGYVEIASSERAKLVSDNIKKDIVVLGVRGSDTVVDTADADATAEDIALGKSAYVNGIKINGQNTGGGSDVLYIDYDGTILNAFSKESFIALNNHIALPQHEGLICQGWNWDLLDAKNYVREYNQLVIGANYITDDNSTKLYINIPDLSNEAYRKLSISYKQSVSEGVTVYWGDGVFSVSTVVNNTITLSHQYARGGRYVIRIVVSNGKITFGSSSDYRILKNDLSTDNSYYAYLDLIDRIELGANVILKSYAFQFCGRVSAITMPDYIDELGANCFYYCMTLECIVSPKQLKNIYAYCCYYCMAMTLFSISKQICSIETNAFNACGALTRFDFPDACTVISSSTFYNNYALKSVSIPNGITTIQSYAFYYCYALDDIRFGNNCSLNTIGQYAFSYCKSLKLDSLPSTLGTMEYSSFYGSSKIIDLIIPNSVQVMGSYNFAYCYGLKKITLPTNNYLKTVPAYMFYYCHQLGEVIIPEGYTTISTYAFAYCRSIIRVDLPSTITSIGACVFYNCYGFRELHVKAITPPSFSNSNAFYNVLSYRIYVPAASLSTYKSASGWSTFASKIYAEPE